MIAWLKEHASFRRYVLKELERRGPLLSREIEDHAPTGREAHRWWGERKMGLMLGVLNARGDVAVVGRKGKQRIWDLAERWYPETERVPLAEAKRAMLERAAARARRLARARPDARPPRRRRQPRSRPGHAPVSVRPAHPRPQTGRRRCSTSATGSRSTSRPRSASSATTSCRYLAGDRILGRTEPVFDRKTGTLRLLGAWGDTSRLDEALADLAAWLGAEQARR